MTFPTDDQYIYSLEVERQRDLALEENVRLQVRVRELESQLVNLQGQMTQQHDSIGELAQDRNRVSQRLRLVEADRSDLAALVGPLVDSPNSITKADMVETLKVIRKRMVDAVPNEVPFRAPTEDA